MTHTQLFGPIRQWGFLVRDIDVAMRCWIEQLGVGPWWGYRNVPMKSKFRGATTEITIHVGFGYQNGVQIELIQQVGGTLSPYRAFQDLGLAQMLHQVAYCVPDLEAARARAAAAGMTLHGEMISAFEQSYFYMESPQLDGIVVELMKSDADFEAAYATSLRETAQWDGRDPYRLVDFSTLFNKT